MEEWNYRGIGWCDSPDDIWSTCLARLNENLHETSPSGRTQLCTDPYTPQLSSVTSHVAGRAESCGGRAPRAHQVQPGQHRGEPVAGPPGEQRLQQGRPGEARRHHGHHGYGGYGGIQLMLLQVMTFGSWSGGL